MRIQYILIAIAALAGAAASAAPAQKPPPQDAPGNKAPPPAQKPPTPIPAPGPGGAPQPQGSPRNSAPSLADLARIDRRLCDVAPLEVAPQGGVRPLSQQNFSCLPWRNVIAWPERDGRRTAYAQWPQARRDKLDLLYLEIQTDAPALSVDCPASPVLTGYLTDRQAEDIYLVHVAHALALEQQRRTPWRLWRLPRAELDVLLGPDAYVSRVRNVAGEVTGYGLPDQNLSNRGLDCDPRVGWRFISGAQPGQPEVLIGATEEETLARLSSWFSREVGHGNYNYRELSERAHLADRLVRYREYGPPQATGYWATMGCWNAAQTFLDLARSANIPLLRTYRGDSPGRGTDHSGLAFRWTRADARILQHADDIYAVDWIAFPIDAAGRALDGPALERAFFETHWATPATLMAHGFDYRITQLPSVPATADYPWGLEIGGWSIGAWGFTPDEARTGVATYALSEAFKWKKAFAIGGYQAINEYCRAFPLAGDEYWQTYVRDRGGDLAPVLGWRDAQSRIRAIEGAWGGCDAIIRRIDAAEAHRRRP